MAAEVPEYFFSYSRTDSEFVLKLARALRAAGADLWLDQLDILGGERWDVAVERALQRCRGMIVVLSPAAVASENLLDEVSYGLEEGKKVIPILYRECNIPFRLRRVHHVDFTRDYEKGLAALLHALSLDEQTEGKSSAQLDDTDSDSDRKRVETASSPVSRAKTSATATFFNSAIFRIFMFTFAGSVIGGIGGWAEKALSDPWQLTLTLLISVIVLSAIALIQNGRHRSTRPILQFELQALGLWAGYTVTWSVINRWWDDFYVMTLLIWLVVAVVGGAALAVRSKR